MDPRERSRRRRLIASTYKQYFRYLGEEEDVRGHGLKRWKCCWCGEIVSDRGNRGAQQHFWRHPEARKIYGNPYNFRTMESECYFGAETIAGILGINRKTLYRWCRRSGYDLEKWGPGVKSDVWLYRGFIVLLVSCMLRSHGVVFRKCRLRVSELGLREFSRTFGYLPRVEARSRRCEQKDRQDRRR